MVVPVYIKKTPNWTFQTIDQEKFMYNRVYNFFTKNNLIYPLQFGFRQQYSTFHALIDLTKDIRKNIHLNHTIKFCKVHHFADDTNLVHFSKSVIKLNKYINIDMENSTSWLNGAMVKWLRLWIPYPRVPCWKPLVISKVDSAFHPSKVDQIAYEEFLGT